ncbi:hypothetical protein GCM10011428_85290 [Streptomyces violaceus]
MGLSVLGGRWGSRGRLGSRGFPGSRVHLEGTGAPDLVRVVHGRLDLLLAAVVDEVVDLHLDEERVGAHGDGPVGPPTRPVAVE